MTTGGESQGDEADSGGKHTSETAADGASDSLRSQLLSPSGIRQHYLAKFTVALVLVVVVIGLVGAGTYVQTQSAIQGDSTDELATTAQLQSNTASEWVAGMRSQTALLADQTRLGSPSSLNYGDANRYLAAGSDRASASVVAVHYVDVTSSRVLVSTQRQLGNETFAAIDQPWADAESGLYGLGVDGVAVTDQSFELGGERALAFVRRVSAQGYVVVTARPPARLAGMNDATGDITTHVLNPSGDRVFQTDGGDALGAGSGFQTALDGGTETVEVDSEVRSYTPVDGTDWVAVSTAQAGTLYGVGSTVGRNVLLLILAAIVSLAAVGFVLGRGTVLPLVDLRQRAQEIEAGNLDVDLSTDREDEIGRLYTSFGSMRDALQQQVREAKQAKASAEGSRKEMERQNRRLDQFASTLSHDLRNPLAVARGHVELLNTKLDADDDDLKSHVEKIDSAHQRIDAIINDVLTLTRKGESVEETERFDLQSVVEEAWSNIDNKDATLTVEDTLAIEGDRRRLLRALENLLRNSIDHVGADVSVTVGLTEDGFFVQDDGPGIPDEEVENIFEYGHTTSEDGTGIGLSIVKTIAEAHGWSLWIDSTYQQGARFVFADVFDSEERIFEESAFTWDNAPTDD